MFEAQAATQIFLEDNPDINSGNMSTDPPPLR